MRTFVLQRTEDISGTSGIGKVAEGVEFSNGTCVIRWLSEMASIGVYDSISILIKVHGHEGRTTAVFDDGSVVI